VTKTEILFHVVLYWHGFHMLVSSLCLCWVNLIISVGKCRSLSSLLSEHSENTGLCSIKNCKQAEWQYIWSPTSTV
jgi:hypothetical protein